MSDQVKTLTFWQIVGSTIAAAFGVQTRKNMQRDLTQGEILKFIAAGIAFTVIFVVTMITLVTLVINHL